VVGGLALLYLLGRTGFGGQLLEAAFGIRLTFTTAAVVIAQTFVAMPFLVISLEGALRTAGERYEAVAGPWSQPLTVFRRVTVPLLLPSLGSGLVLAFAAGARRIRCHHYFAGSLQGTTQTLPLLVYVLSQSDVDVPSRCRAAGCPCRRGDRRRPPRAIEGRV